MPFALTNQQHQSTDSNQGKSHTRLQPFLSNQTTCANLYHILRTLLPPPTAQKYSLRNRPQNRQLPDRISRITDCNFTVRMLYRNMYWLLYILHLRFVLFLCTTAVWQFAINEYVMLCYVTCVSWHHQLRTGGFCWDEVLLPTCPCQ